KLEGLHHKNPDLWKFVSPFEKGRLQIGNAQWADDTSPIQDGCDCWTCKSGYTKAYLRHLYRVDELLYFRLASIHNVRFMIRLTEQLRTAILGDQSMS
ncbi:MAG TPA: tRNA-guanine transglycosylase, partial [Patescibacteria group bacterium]|nr:tRNA-guanine transglycosylase [Patescibacteria group bacterium]